jgi:hypothetical protein
MMKRICSSRLIIIALAWVGSTVIGGMISGWLVEISGGFLGDFLTGFVIGIAQWIGLARFVQYSWLWAIATGFGWILGWGNLLINIPMGNLAEMLQSIFSLPESIFLAPSMNAIQLALAGLAQWLILSRQFQNTWIWLPMSVLGGGVLGLVGASFCAAYCDSLMTSVGREILGIALGGISWLSYALVMLPALLAIARRPS